MRDNQSQTRRRKNKADKAHGTWTLADLRAYALKRRHKVEPPKRYASLTQEHVDHLQREEAMFENFENIADLLPTDLELEAVDYFSGAKSTINSALDPWRDRVKAYVENSLGVLFKMNVQERMTGAEKRETYLLRDKLVGDICHWVLQGLRDGTLQMPRYVDNQPGHIPMADPVEMRYFHRINSVFNRDVEHLRKEVDVKVGEPGSFSTKKEVQHFAKKDSLQEFTDQMGQSRYFTHGTPALDTSDLTELDMPDPVVDERVRNPRVLVSSLVFSEPNKDSEPFVLSYQGGNGWDWENSVPDVCITSDDIYWLVNRMKERGTRGLIRVAKGLSPRIRKVMDRRHDLVVLEEMPCGLIDNNTKPVKVMANIQESERYVDEYKLFLGREYGDPGMATKHYEVDTQNIGGINTRVFLVWCSKCNAWVNHVKDVIDYRGLGVKTEWGIVGNSGDYRCMTCGNFSEVRVMRFRYEERLSCGLREDGRKKWWDVTAILRTGSLGFIEDFRRLRPDAWRVIEEGKKKLLSECPAAFWFNRPLPNIVRIKMGQAAMAKQVRELLTGF